MLHLLKDISDSEAVQELEILEIIEEKIWQSPHKIESKSDYMLYNGTVKQLCTTILPQHYIKTDLHII